MNGTWFVIAGMALVTCLPRVVPILLLSGKKMPKTVERWLSFVPPAILAALLAPELFLDRNDPTAPILVFSSVYLKAAIPAFIVAWKTKSLFGTVATGIVAAALLRIF